MADKDGSLKGKDSAGEGRQVQFPSIFYSEDSLDDNDVPAVKTGDKVPLDSLKTGKKPSLDSLKSGGKASDASKGFSGKGGKDYKTGKDAGEGVAGSQLFIVLLETNAKLAIELPKNAKILMDCEAADILEGIQECLPSISQDPSLKMPVSFTRALQHVQTGVQYSSSKSVRQVLNGLKSKGISDGEICMIASICPESVEEVYALVPSLKDNKQKNEEALRDALSQLSKFRKVVQSSEP